MKDIYFKTIVVPTKYPDLFADFLLSTTQEAIEEVLFNTLKNMDFDYFGNSSDVIPEQAFIIYSSKEPAPLLQDLRLFCETLTQRTQQNDIGVYHHTSVHDLLDWIKTYQENTTPITCGKFHIVPSWVSSLGDENTIILDPALAFGTGRHESSAMILEMLSRLSCLKGRLALDIGCGSGILSLALAKLGARIHACDTDTLAITESTKNFAKNGLALDRIWHGSVEQIPKNTFYDFITINIIPEVIAELYPAVLEASAEGTMVFLSGILESKKDAILDIYNKGFRILECLNQNEWVCLRLERAKQT
ncbi:50S ribosomal protein L11 methyltransferase [Helicobacter cynogastricus]|uniref:50S ribosomal protein L11 methyltransferase n=1 Tax=Helicobacter cynogastricus TaxID=329937 RepID=UPI000CF02F65|nr:50S ribosomal protein L11 methyltransferase [Helicobacter cynogastricus]